MVGIISVCMQLVTVVLYAVWYDATCSGKQTESGG